MTPRIGSLCSGYGGLELGLITVVGGSVAWHVEYDKHPSAVLDVRFPGVPNYGDVKTTDWTAVEPVDVLTAGYPCQPFSGAGLRLGEADERHLWPHVADAIRVLRPRRVLLENVAGHLSLGFGSVLGDLAALGYDVRWVCLRAADAGAPHNRARVFIAATDARGERHGGGQNGRSVGRVDREDAGEARQRERSRPVAVDRGAAAPAHTGSGPFSGAPTARDGLSVAPERGDESAADAGSRGWGQEDPRGRGVVGESGVQTGRDEGAGSPRPDRDAPADTDGDGRPRLAGLPAERGAIHGHGGCDADGRGAVVEWGAYAAAITRWELVTGRPAPRPTEPGRTGERLSPRFVEWMMGLPVGWVTDILPRNPALKALGNGVVPQQAALAVRTLLAAEAVAA